VIAESLLYIGKFAEKPDSVPDWVNACWMRPAKTLAEYEWECWTISERFNYTGYYPSTGNILAFTATGTVIFTILATVAFCFYFKRSEDHTVIFGFTLFISFIVTAAVFIMGIYYEEVINETNPRIKSSFFIFCWIIVVINWIVLVISIFGIRGKKQWAYCPTAINFGLCCLFLIWWIICQIIGIVIEPHWSLPFFTFVMTVLMVFIYSIKDVMEPLNGVLTETNNRLNEVQQLCNCSKGALIIGFTVIILFPALGVAFILLVVWMCFSTVQHESMTFSLMQGILNLIIGGIAIAIQRAQNFSETMVGCLKNLLSSLKHPQAEMLD